MKKLFDQTLWKFLLVGILNTVVGNGLMFLLYNVTPMGYWSSTALSYALASVMSYYLNKYFTFKMKDAGWSTAYRFALNIAVCYVLAYGLAQPAAKMLLASQSEKLRENAAMLLGMCLFTGLNYLGQRFFAFRQTEKKPPLLRKDEKAPLFLSFLLPFVLMGVIFFVNGVLFGSRMVLSHDMWHQYYPFFVEFGRTLREGGSLLYNHSVGLGINYISLISYYLASPVNLLAAVIPEGFMVDAYALILLVKISLSSLFFAVFLRIAFRRCDLTTVCFAICYAFCSFVMGYYWNIMWLDTFALLPLVIAGALELLRKGHWKMYTLTLALSLWCSYYIGLFVCIAVVLFFFGYQFSYWNGFGSFFRSAFHFTICSLLAGGAVAVLMIPAYLGLQNTYSAINKFPEGLSLNIASKSTWLGVLDAMRQVFGNQAFALRTTSMSGLPNIYCGVAPLFLSAMYCFNNRFRVRERICCVLVLLFFASSFIFRQLDYIWHGCHFTNMLPYRFSFLYSFVVIVMAYRAWSAMDHMKWYHSIIGMLTVLAAIGCAFVDGFKAYYLITIPVALLVGYVTRVFHRKPNFATLFLALICMLDCTVSGVRGVDEVGVTSRKDYPKNTQDVQTVLQSVDHESSDWFRVETSTTQALNDGALNGFNGVTIFSSTANKAASDFLLHLGIASWPASNRYAYFESPPFTNLMLNLRYIINREGDHLAPSYNTVIAQSGDVTLQENQTYLPMGFMVRPEILEYDVKAAHPFAMTAQNKMFTLLTGMEDNLFTSVKPDEKKCDTTEITDGSSPNRYYYKGEGLKKKPEIYFIYNLKESGLFCAYLQSKGADNLRVYVNGEFLMDRPIRVGSLMVLGEYEKGTEIKLKIEGKDEGDKNSISLQAGYFNQKAFDAAYHSLSHSVLKATESTDRSLTGVIDVQDDGLFYTSIPYEPGWTAKVDGEKVEITPVGGVMIAFPLTKGSHVVEISYLTPGLVVGGAISGVCILLILLIALWKPTFFVPERRQKRKVLKETIEEASEEPESTENEELYTVDNILEEWHEEQKEE